MHSMLCITCILCGESLSGRPLIMDPFMDLFWARIWTHFGPEYATDLV